MGKKLNGSTFILESRPKIKSYSSTVGKKEGDGALGEWFDKIEEDSHLGKETWEEAESELQRETVERAIEKANLKTHDIDYMFGGDLINQCTSTTYGIKDMDIPFFGIYGACSTMSEGLVLASMLTEGGMGGNIVATTSSHFSTAERQFRYPLSYGGQRTPTSQWTCTASGAVVVSDEGAKASINAVTIGKIVDLGISDVNNMGAAMAPSAMYTIKKHLTDTHTKPEDYDCIVTGDLGKVGSELLLQLLEKEGIDISKQHMDCGSMMFRDDEQDTHAGGSGCGCSASVLCGYFLKKIENKELNNILFMSTGALMSPMVLEQGKSIPGISHLVHISSI